MADMMITFDARIGSVMRKMAKLGEAQLKVKGGTKALTKEVGKLERGLNKKGKAAGDAGGSIGSLTSKIQSMVSPAAALTVGVLAVKRALASMGEEASRAKDRLLALQEPTKKLQQIAGQVAKDLGIPIEDAFRFLKKKAEDIAKTGAIPGGFAGAIETIFQSVSGGSFSAIDEIVEAAKFTDPTAVSAALGKLRDPAGFGPGIGSPAGVISKFAFAAPISDFLIEEQTKQASELVSFAKEAGIGFDELLAALTGASRGFPNPQRQTTGFRAILSTIRKVEAERGEPFAGRTIFEKLRAFEAADPERFAQAKNREEFVLGLGPIRGASERTRGLLPQITAEGKTLAAFREEVGLADIPEIKGPREARGAAEALRIIRAETLGALGLKSQQAADELQANRLRLRARNFREPLSLRDEFLGGAGTTRGTPVTKFLEDTFILLSRMFGPEMEADARGAVGRSTEREIERRDRQTAVLEQIEQNTRELAAPATPADAGLGPSNRELDNEVPVGGMR